jgi:hypothetical protein
MTNLHLRFSPSTGPLLATACSTISPTIRTDSHRLLSHCTVAWLSLTPQFGAIQFALATHSALLPVTSLVVQPDLSAATPPCKATLPDSSFISYSLPQLLHHLRLLRTPAIFDFASLNPVLDWFFDHYSRIAGIGCSCPHTSLPDQLLWLRSVFDLIDFLSTHFQLSCFFLIVPLPADLDCGVSLADLALHWRTDSWQLQTGPTSSALYDDAVHARRWICIGLRQGGLFPPPVPSFPPLGTLPLRHGDHVNPSFNHISDDCFPLPASARSPPPALLIPSTVPHPIAVLQSLPLHSTPSSFFVLDPDFPTSEPILSTHPLLSPFSATFGLLFTSSFGTNYVCAFTLFELLSCYSALLVDSSTLSSLSTASTIGRGYMVNAICKALRLPMLFGPSSSTRAAYRATASVILIPVSLGARSDVSLATSHRIRVPASPPNRQSQNDLVESHWKIACKTARSFLAEAHLPKSFWFWALRGIYVSFIQTRVILHSKYLAVQPSFYIDPT